MDHGCEWSCIVKEKRVASQVPVLRDMASRGGERRIGEKASHHLSWMEGKLLVAASRSARSSSPDPPASRG